MDVEPEKPKVILYSARDIAEIYPNNIGLQKALSQFISQMKIRVVDHKMVRTSAYTTQIRVGYYSARKLKKALEDYISKSQYKLCGDRKNNLTTLLELITNKIDKEVEDEKKSRTSSHS